MRYNSYGPQNRIRHGANPHLSLRLKHAGQKLTKKKCLFIINTNY